MPTNDERRKIAETLRSGVGTTDYMSDGAFIEWLFRVIGRSCDGHILDSLADLIEPEERTCHMRDASWDDGQCTWGCICSECGAKHEHERGGWMNFCPNCGARVIQE